MIWLKNYRVGVKQQSYTRNGRKANLRRKTTTKIAQKDVHQI